MNLHKLRKEQASGAFDKLSSLRSIQINPVENFNNNDSTTCFK